jgi:NitT/TauT family transport system substrate-binding protein
MTHAERGFESLADVFKSPGTIAMQKGLPYALYLQSRYSSGKRASVVPYLGGVANFLGRKDHSQQCFVTSEPLLAVRQGAKVKTFLVADSGFNPYTTVLSHAPVIASRKARASKKRSGGRSCRLAALLWINQMRRTKR